MSAAAFRPPTEAVFDPPPARGSWAGPKGPWFLPAGWLAKPVSCRSLEDLARKVHRLRAGRALQLVSGSMTWAGSSTFRILRLYLIAPDGGEGEYAGALYVMARPREAFEAILAETNPDLPAEFAA